MQELDIDTHLWLPSWQKNPAYCAYPAVYVLSLFNFYPVPLNIQKLRASAERWRITISSLQVEAVQYQPRLVKVPLPIVEAHLDLHYRLVTLQIPEPGRIIAQARNGPFLYSMNAKYRNDEKDVLIAVCDNCPTFRIRYYAHDLYPYCMQMFLHSQGVDPEHGVTLSQVDLAKQPSHLLLNLYFDLPAVIWLKPNGSPTVFVDMREIYALVKSEPPRWKQR
jgi:hypothetical protein